MNAIVTGAGGGIGRAAAVLFAENGCNILCVDIGDLEGTLQEIAGLQDAGSSDGDDGSSPAAGKAVGMKADVGDEAQSRAVVERCVAEFGGLDIYFANAGVMGKHTELADSPLDDFERTVRVNTVGPFLAIKHAAPVMVEAGGGAFIVTTSVAAVRADVTPLGYSASKAAALSLVTSAADKLIGTGVRVNGIMPGGVMTPMVQEVQQGMRERKEKIQGYDFARFPPAMPEAIAEAAMFLASDRSQAVNGHVLVCDGGMSNSMGFTLKREAGGGGRKARL